MVLISGFEEKGTPSPLQLQLWEWVQSSPSLDAHDKPSRSSPVPLEEIGIKKSLANRARRLSEIPEESFEKMIQDRREQATQKVTKAVE